MSTEITRKALLQRGAAGVTVLSLPGLLAACGGGGGGSGDGGELKDVLNFSNWPFYMDVEGKKHPTLDQFTAETGIKVNYFEDVNSNDEYFAKVQGRLSQGQGIDRDIIVATDNSRFPGALRRRGLGAAARQGASSRTSRTSSRRRHRLRSIPTGRTRCRGSRGMDGIAWNEDVTGPVTSITQLLEDPKLKGKVTVLSEMSDTIGLVLLDNGDDPAAVTDESFDRALAAHPGGRRLRPDPTLHGQRLRRSR